MQKNKKGQRSQTLNMILIVGSAVVLLLFFGGWMLTQGGEDKVKTCQLSVVTQAGTSFGIVDKDSPFNINCNKRYVTFYNTRVELGYSPEDMDPIPVKQGSTKSKKFTELNELIVNQVIAEELRICKYQFGDGKLKVFPNDDSGANQKNTCFVCSEINFDLGIKEKAFTELKDFTTQTTYSDEGITYYDYLTELTISGNPTWLQPSSDGVYGDLNINTQKTYLIFFEKADVGKLDLFHWKDGYFVAILPQEEINNYCEIQAS